LLTALIYQNCHTEKTLLQLASTGNEEAFTRLFSLYKDKLYSFALRLTGCKEKAQDIVQEVFLKLWQNQTSLNTIENFSSYIFKLAQNQFLNAAKRMANESLIISKIHSTTNVYNAPPDEKLECKEVESILHEVIQKLPPQQKLIFKLSREQGLKHEEIATQLQISPSTVKNHLVQSLKTIRKYLSSNLDIAGLYFLVIDCFLLKK
jgi:RNA polymerase sigma-70 factor (family 1)